MRLPTLLFLLCPFFAVHVESSLDCRAPGPVVPKPRHIHSHELFLAATERLTNALEAALAGDIEAGWPVENTSFSIGLITHDQDDGAMPAWEYHHLSANNVNGTRRLSRDSQFLIGSISKVISDYILLRSGLDLGESIVAFIPELDGNGSLIQWRDITIGHLANQVAGIPPNYGFSEYYYLKDYFESLGFPHVADNAFADCGIIGLNNGCTREQFLEGMLRSYPVAQPAERPVYSNIAFTLLMYAVEARTGTGYSELLQAYVSDPLGLKNTSVSPGDDEKAVIPPVDNSWGSDYGDRQLMKTLCSGGGLVSSLSDLSIFVHQILAGTLFGSDTTAVREWLKPTSSTGSLYSLVGTPWKIFRTNDLTPDHPHTVDIYAKGGAAYGYQSQMAILDEYGAGILLLTAGSPLAVQPIYDAVLATLVPALDEIAREQARMRGYTGTFVEDPFFPCGNSSASADVNVTVIQDTDSLVLHGIERDGKDILAALHEIWAVTIGGFLAVTPSKARIFPIQIRNEGVLTMSDGTEKRVVHEDWRLEWEFVASVNTDLPGAGLSARNCLGWTLTDWMYYGSEPIDRLVFVLDAETEEVVGLEIPYLRSGVLMSVTAL
ncbi:beta-lactamase/transpeptidase-like protein [Xylaria arbuscula]|nr:beta-lactamase/transpeptidase-like protein [Xylaria arbuscula]